MHSTLFSPVERQLTTGKRAESTKRDFRCQSASLPLVKPVVGFARAVFKWRSLNHDLSRCEDYLRAITSLSSIESILVINKQIVLKLELLSAGYDTDNGHDTV